MSSPSIGLVVNTIGLYYYTVSGTLSSCIKLRKLELYLPFDTSSTFRLARFLATGAFDTRSGQGFELDLVFEAYPGCVAPTVDIWRDLDSALQAPTYEFLGCVFFGQLSMIIPEESQMVWGNNYSYSTTASQAFKNDLETLLPQTYRRRLLWWWHSNGDAPVPL